MLDLAVRDGRLPRNVAERINLPRPVRVEQRFLTIAQVEALAIECGHPSTNSKHRRLVDRDYEPYRLAVLFLAYTGVRFGENGRAAGRPARRGSPAGAHRRVGHRGTASRHGLGSPKTHQIGEVPIPRSLAGELAAHAEGKTPDELVFTGVRSGGPIRVANFRRGNFDAAKRSGFPACTRTSCGTRPPASPSPTGPTSRCPADAGPRLSDHDAGHLRTPVREPSRRGCGRPRSGSEPRGSWRMRRKAPPAVS